MNAFRFSRKGEKPTPDEIALVTQAAMVADNVWAVIGGRASVEALFVVLDELGSEKIYVPTRAAFVQALFRPLRDAMIADARARGLSVRETALEADVSATTVLRCSARGTTRNTEGADDPAHDRNRPPQKAPDRSADRAAARRRSRAQAAALRSRAAAAANRKPRRP